MKNLIFESLVEEARSRTLVLTKRGKPLSEALAIVSEEMSLESDEVAEVEHRIKKAPPVVKEKAPQPIIEEEPVSTKNTVYFDSLDEMETAMGVLMYKGIPWETKGTDHLVFSSAETVKKVQEALSRRWSFFDSEPRNVASIHFDNMEDFRKVVDFMASKKMGMILRDANGLENDVDHELAEAESCYKKAKKEAKAAGLPLPEAPVSEMNYRAIHKDHQIKVENIDVESDPLARCLHVVKKWR